MEETKRERYRRKWNGRERRNATEWNENEWKAVGVNAWEK